MPGNNHNVVFGMNNPNKPMIAVATNIFKTALLGALVLVNLNTKKTHGTIIKKQAIAVAVTPPAIPKKGTKNQQRTAVIKEPNIKIYIGILGFPIP